MPQTVQQVIDHAAEIAARDGADDGGAIGILCNAVTILAQAELAMHEAIQSARADGYSWPIISSLLGISEEDAIARYGVVLRTPRS